MIIHRNEIDKVFINFFLSLQELSANELWAVRIKCIDDCRAYNLTQLANIKINNRINYQPRY